MDSARLVGHMVQASDIIAWNNLNKISSLDMPNLDKRRVKGNDIGQGKRTERRHTFPMDNPSISSTAPSLVDVE